MLVTAIVAVVLTRYARSNPDEKILKRIRYTMATLLVVAVALDPILTLRRYGMNEAGWGLVVDSSLPLYLCDVVSLFLAYALVTKNQRVTEIGYLWGCAGTIQGLIRPTLWFNWATIEFYILFLQHSGVPIAVVFLIWGLKICPKKGAWVRSFYWSWGYMAITMTINWMIGKNYGFLNSLPEVYPLFSYMGPCPY